ncbi:hypothetical protein Naga_101283g1 [Nannochloropsis gaditana]|uniref:Uncharacterized protein n=1 Tax=Nannochloropsis gaditana TaxID=72520 RepID=W7U0B1_9STRA|nr:hypothetical protein Naga_101283g1 [Nannochloropsis gaditana]
MGCSRTSTEGESSSTKGSSGLVGPRTKACNVGHGPSVPSRRRRPSFRLPASSSLGPSPHRFPPDQHHGWLYRTSRYIVTCLSLF